MSEPHGYGQPPSAPLVGKVSVGFVPVPGGYAPISEFDEEYVSGKRGDKPVYSPPDYTTVAGVPQPNRHNEATPGQYPDPQQLTSPPAQQPVVTTQPGSWMNKPQGIFDCPRGLEFLAAIDRVSMYQRFEKDASALIRDNNKFTIQNYSGELVYMAVEDANCCTRDCECCPSCPYDMKIVDSSDNEIIHISRPLRCECCCCPCCLQIIEISSPSGNVFGTVKQNWSPIYPNFSLYNESGDEILKITGPCNKTGDVQFQIATLDGTKIGIITKLASGVTAYTLEYYNERDGFGLTFPFDLDVKLKAVCLGAVFLIKSMYFVTQTFGRLNRN